MLRFEAYAFLNKVVKPHIEPLVALVLTATGNNVIQDATAFTGFGMQRILRFIVMRCILGGRLTG